MKHSQLKSLIITALCIALGVVLPLALHAIPNAGSIFLPMHIPVLLCGLLCGWPFGLACGIAAPLLSSFLTGMPPAPVLPAMLCELAVYGFVSGVLSRVVHVHKPIVNMTIALIGAMLAGRIVAGLVKALIFNVGAYSMQAWLTSSFVTALPGVAIQLVLIPILVQVLIKARLTEPVLEMGM